MDGRERDLAERFCFLVFSARFHLSIFLAAALGCPTLLFSRLSLLVLVRCECILDPILPILAVLSELYVFPRELAAQLADENPEVRAERLSAQAARVLLRASARIQLVLLFFQSWLFHLCLTAFRRPASS